MIRLLGKFVIHLLALKKINIAFITTVVFLVYLKNDIKPFVEKNYFFAIFSHATVSKN